MKKLIASASLLAVGAIGLQAQYAPGLTRAQTSKPWSVAASLRGFYDDNYATAPSDSPADRDSLGFEISPQASINLPMETSYIGATYKYSAKYFEDRDQDEFDQAHDFRLDLDHRFSERFNIDFDDNFVFASEPDLIAGGTPIRTDADAFRNTADLDFNALFSERFGGQFGYYNYWADYDDSGTGSRSAQLDRFEHRINVDGRYQLRETTTGVFGYQYGIVDYTGDEFLRPETIVTRALTSDDRDNTSHYVYIGADTDLTSNLNASLRAGIQYTDFDYQGEDDYSPYFNGTATYRYAPGSQLQFGITHRRTATDVVGSANDPDPVLDQETTSAFASVNHRITPRLNGNGIISGQMSEFNGGSFDGEDDMFLIMGAYLEYKINEFLNAEAGYNFDRLNSDLSNRSFTRNRVFLGLRASY